MKMFCLSFITTFVVQWLLVGAQNGNIITKDTYFYGQSPLVPPPSGTGAGNWSVAYTKANAFVAQLSLDEKINFTAGVTADNGCSG
jgi:beta-glucosidase